MKKILTMLLTLIMIMGVFTGCGANGTGVGGSKEITVSEMLNSVLEEKGEVVIYRMVLDGDKWSEDYSPSKNSKVFYELYNGETITTMIPSSTNEARNPVGNYLDGTCVADIKHTNSANWDMPDDMYVFTDKDGNTLCQTMTDTNLHAIHFGSFERKEINGVSCMVFTTYNFFTDNASKGWKGRLDEVYYTIIEDTDYTKDKTIVLDSADTKGVKVEKWDSKAEHIRTFDAGWTIE